MKKPFNIDNLIDRNALVAGISIKNKQSRVSIQKIGFDQHGNYNSALKQINGNMYNLLNFSTIKKAAVVLFFLAMYILPLSAQDSIRVRGTIVSENNEAVANVSVSIEGSFELPVITDKNGIFEVISSSPDNWLIITPASLYKTKRVFINNRKEMKIILSSEDMISGDDFLQILAQRRERKNIISSFSDLEIKNIYKTGALSIDQQMQGKIAGMNVINRSGDPASGAVSLIRGVNSLNSNNLPLYIIDGIFLTPHSLFGSNVDGFEYNPLLSVSMFDISKALVVKDPTVTAAYGSKASNGLILIETLDPSATKTSIEVDLRTGYSLSPQNAIPQLNANQHKTLINEILFSSGIVAEDIKEQYPNLFLKPSDQRYIDYQHNTDWQKQIFSNSSQYSMNVKVKGGDEIARYGLSLGYNKYDGIIKNTGYDGYNLRFVSLLNIFGWLKMDAGVSLNYGSSSLKESAKVKETSPILTALAKSPMLGPFEYDINGNMLTTLANVDELGVSNPLAVITNYEASNTNFYFTSNLNFEVTFNKNLSLKTNFGLSYNVLKESLFMPNKGMEHYYSNEAINVSKASNNDFNSFSNITYLKYDKTFNKNHKFSSTTGLNIQNNVFEYDWGLTKNAHASDKYRFLQNGISNLREIGGENRIWNWVSVYESLNYSFKDKYIATATISLDGSSRIGDNAENTVKIGSYPFGLFYAGGIGWRISSEPFLKRVSWLEELKFRATYGKTGNDDIGESNASNYYKSVKYRTTVGLYPATIPNDKLTYETVSQLDLGIDLAIFGNRIRASFDYFNTKTDNMLIYSPLESYLGYSYRPENGGKLQNKGMEFSAFFRIIDKKSFKWDLQATLSKSSNKVIEIKGDKFITDIEGAQIVNMNGETANSFYGYIFEGVYATDAEATSAGLVNDKNFAFHAGDVKFKDMDGNKIINNQDKTIIGSALPDYFGGIVNTFSIKRWTLSAFVQFTKGNDVFNYVRYKNESMSGLYNQSVSTLNRWEKDGDVTNIPRAFWKDPMGNSAFSSRWIEDGSYLRLKNVVLSYRIPNTFLAFQNAEFYISASNIFTLTKYLGYDPEFAYSYSQINQGIDYGLTPQPRQFIVGIKLGL